MEGKGPGLLIAIGSPKMGGHGGGMGDDYHDDPMTLEAIKDATKQFFEAGKAGDYDKAAKLLCMIFDMKAGGDPYEAKMEYGDNPGGGMKY